MDVQLIALHMENKTIDAVDVVQGESELIIYLSDGSSVELIVDSIHMNIQDLDD